MDDYLDNSKNNIFDIDNFDNIYLSNLTYSNGFKQLFPKKNQNNFYIKKRVNKNIRNRNRNNSSHIEQPETMITEKNYYPSDITENSLGIETIPIFNVKLSQSNEKNEKGKLDKQQKISLNKKIVKNLINKSKNKNKKINKNISNSSIDEINISLKKLNINGCNNKNSSYIKDKNNNMINSSNIISENNKNNNSINNKILKNKNSSFSNDVNNETKTKLNNKTKSKSKKVSFSDNHKKMFNNLIIKNENRFCYINNINENYKKIIFLKKIIYSQNINIKSLREQNQKLIEKIQKMNEENQSILELINSLKSEIILSNIINQNKNKNENEKEIEGNDNTNSTKNMLKKYFTYPNENNNNAIEIKENIFNSNKIIYSLYNNNNLLSYNFAKNEFKLSPINNKDFQNNFNKEINTLFLFNNTKYIFYTIAGINNDQLFIYNIKLNKMEKKSKLKNNHMFGNLLLLPDNKISEKGQLICLSGKFNKKVEIYNEENDSWNDKIIEEMPEERCNSSYLIINNNYIYGFYGYNYILNKYLNDIVYYDLNNNKWNKIINNSLNNEIKGIKNHFCYENKKDKLIYILGGDNNCNQIIIDLEKRKIKIDIDKNIENNNKFSFNNNIPFFLENNCLAIFDNNFNIHIINFFSNEKDFIQYQ